MTGRRLELEAFATAPKPVSGVNEAELQIATEAARMAGYDAGYKTGWDDAMRQTRDEGERIGAEFARNLRDLSFTYHEARAHVLRSLEGLLRGVMTTFLPSLVSESLGPILQEEISTLAEEAASAPILIRAAPAEAEKLRKFLADETGLPIQIVDEPSLAEGQAHLKLGSEERDVDLSAPLQTLSDAMAALGQKMERMLDERRTG